MNRNRKMLIVLVALCLIIGVGVAGTLKRTTHINDSVSLMLIAAELDTADFRHARAVIFY